MEKHRKLLKLEKRIKECRRCRLWRIRLNTVPGEGPANAKIMFLGQNPGRNEDAQGKPFVGVSGKFFEKLLSRIGLERREVFITGVVKCHTPKNRQPVKHEIEACQPYFLEQIEIIKPRLIVILGNVALKALFPNEKISVSKSHGKLMRNRGITCLLTFHPAAGMRFPSIRRKMEGDFKKLERLISTRLSNS
ncbi:MAG: uracil-DNA glycosylase [Thermoproteota archaeon]